MQAHHFHHVQVNQQRQPQSTSEWNSGLAGDKAREPLRVLPPRFLHDHTVQHFRHLESQAKQNLIEVKFVFILSFRNTQMEDICQSDVIQTVLFNLVI